MRVNVYIRKDNEGAWEESGKSNWINSLLITDHKEKKITLPSGKKDVVEYTALNGTPRNPFQCKTCGMLKVAGKCITKGCKG